LTEEHQTQTATTSESSTESRDTRSRSRPPQRRTRSWNRRRDGRRRRKTTACSPRCVGFKGAKISYKQVDVLKRFVTDRGKIRPRRQTGNCAKHQRVLAREIKRARFIALLPFTAEHDFSSDDRR